MYILAAWLRLCVGLAWTPPPSLGPAVNQQLQRGRDGGGEIWWQRTRVEILLQIESTAMWTADCPLTYVYRLKRIQPSITRIASTGKRFPQETGKHKRLYTRTHIFNFSCLTSIKKVYTCTATYLYLAMCLYVRASVRMNNSSRGMLSAEASAPDRGWKIHARLAGRRPMRDHRRRVEKREKTVEKVTSG